MKQTLNENLLKSVVNVLRFFAVIIWFDVAAF